MLESTRIALHVCCPCKLWRCDFWFTLRLWSVTQSIMWGCQGSPITWGSTCPEAANGPSHHQYRPAAVHPKQTTSITATMARLTMLFAVAALLVIGGPPLSRHHGLLFAQPHIVAAVRVHSCSLLVSPLHRYSKPRLAVATLMPSSLAAALAPLG